MAMYSKKRIVDALNEFGVAVGRNEDGVYMDFEHSYVPTHIYDECDARFVFPDAPLADDLPYYFDLLEQGFSNTDMEVLVSMQVKRQNIGEMNYMKTYDVVTTMLKMKDMFFDVRNYLKWHTED